MNIIEVNPPKGYYRLEYPTGNDMDAVRLYAETLAPHVDALIAKANERGMTPVLVCRGSSGAMLTSALSMFMKERPKVIHVKKDGESAHSHHSDISKPYAPAYIVVDDFVASGGTLAAIAEGLNATGLYGLVLSDWSAEGVSRTLGKIEVTFDNLVNLNRS